MPNLLVQLAIALSLGLPAWAMAQVAAPKDLPPAEGVPNASSALPRQAYLVLRKHCYGCHGVQRIAFNVLRHEELLAAPYIVPTDLDNSLIWSRVGGEHADMPPRSVTVRPTEAEVDLLKRWIQSGAERFPPEEPRSLLDEAYVLTEIATHLRSVPESDRSNLRYFSLAHLYNNANITDDELRIYRAALSKTINSLSRKPEIVLPQAIDKAGTVFSLDLRQVGWNDRRQWLEVLKAYPYGMKWNDNKLAQLVGQIQDLWARNRLLADQVAYLRADWFVVKASRSPVYEALLQLPDTETALEAQLGVDFQQDFRSGELARAGVTQSGVSHNNRLIDRHVGRATPYYYKSFDFGKGNGRSILALHPLGPAFDKHPFPNEAFQQDGGEIVFSLPNGLQGYLIVDSKGKSIPEAPVSVVRDLKEISGTPVVVNGISCIGCHTRGIQRYEDNLAPVVKLFDKAGEKFTELFKSNERQAALQRADTERFLVAAEKATGPFLLVRADQKKQVTDFPEPVSALAQYYHGAVSLEAAACELGEPVAALKTTIPLTRELQTLGLGPMGAGFRIAREFWESRADHGDSVFQKASKALNKGLPISDE